METPAGNPSKPEPADLTYRIPRVFLTVQLDVLDEQGRVAEDGRSKPLVVHEADFDKTVKEILLSKGLKLTKETP